MDVRECTVLRGLQVTDVAEIREGGRVLGTFSLSELAQYALRLREQFKNQESCVGEALAALKSVDYVHQSDNEHRLKVIAILEGK